MNTLLIFGYCVGERVSKQAALGYGSCITAVDVLEGRHEQRICSKRVPNKFRDAE